MTYSVTIKYITPQKKDHDTWRYIAAEDATDAMAIATRRLLAFVPAAVPVDYIVNPENYTANTRDSF